MSFGGELNLAFETVAGVLDLQATSNTYGDLYTLRNTQTGQFAGSANIWSLFRDALDQIGGSQALAELGLT
jgi:hypothetical protein